MRIETFAMERFQSLHWHEVEYDLSESGVLPLSPREVLGDDAAEIARIVDLPLAYPLSEGSELARARIAAWYPGGAARDVTIVNGGSEANMLVLWTLLEPGDRLALMVPNYMQAWGLGRHFSAGTDPFHLRRSRGGGEPAWELDVDDLERAVSDRTKVIMVCTPNNPTGHVLSASEMDAVVAAAARVGAWIVSDEIYRGAEVDGERTSPTFWGRHDRVVVTGGLSKAFGMPGLRLGWVVAPAETIADIWIRHDYTTLTPGVLSDALAAAAMEPDRRERILARTRGIIRRHLPSIEAWVRSHDDVFSFARPRAGAIAYVEYNLPVASSVLVDRARTEHSVLLVAGEDLGGSKAFRLGYGYDLDRTLKGLARVDELLEAIRR
jgi:aspartate/methionine/tyrosine aminotransferase